MSISEIERVGIEEACQQVWENRRPLGGAFWHELPDEMTELAMGCYRAGALTGKSRVGVTDEMVEDAYRAGNKEYARIYGTAPFGETSDNDRSIMRAALEAALPSDGVAPTHRHKKRGTEYVLIGVGKMQAETWEDMTYQHQVTSVDMREVAIYRSVDDGSLWARPIEEFNDGRFEAIEPTQAQGERKMTGFLDTLTEDQLKAAMEYRGEDNHPAPAPDELEVVAWTTEGDIKSVEKRPSQTACIWGRPNGIVSVPLVHLTDVQRILAEKDARIDYIQKRLTKAGNRSIDQLLQDLTTLRAERERLERELEKSKQIAVAVAIKSENNEHRAKTAEASVAVLARTLQSVNRALRDEAGSAVFRSGVKVATLLGQINAALQEEEGGNG